MSYEGVGVRDIAAEAGVDPALVIRYFGSKEDLFREVAAQAFGVDEFLAGGIADFPARAVELIAGGEDAAYAVSGYDPLRLLLSSIGSPTAGPILAAYLDADIVKPLADALSGRHARERAAMITANIIGFVVIRIALATDGEGGLRRKALGRLLATTLGTLSADGS
jgi:AcrR family transcriptional regulator